MSWCRSALGAFSSLCGSNALRPDGSSWFISTTKVVLGVVRRDTQNLIHEIVGHPPDGPVIGTYPFGSTTNPAFYPGLTVEVVSYLF
jgi:hypothetical protein